MSTDKPAGTPNAHTPKDTHYARLRRQHRDQNQSGATMAAEPLRLYGLHTVRSAIDNPERRILRMLVTRNAAGRLGIDDPAALAFPAEIVDPKTIDRLLGGEAVHQGAMIEVEALKPKRLSELGDSRLVLVLDQVTDPHNVGAILRSAVAFGAGAVVTASRHSPEESGVLAKAASGALELMPHIEVRNLAEALQELASAGFQTIGLDSEGEGELEASLSGERIALVLGAEGKGLRQKTRETVDRLARLDMPGAIKSLNVSNAAAVSLYAARRWLDRPAG